MVVVVDVISDDVDVIANVVVVDVTEVDVITDDAVSFVASFFFVC